MLDPLPRPQTCRQSMCLLKEQLLGCWRTAIHRPPPPLHVHSRVPCNRRLYARHSAQGRPRGLPYSGYVDRQGSDSGTRQSGRLGNCNPVLSQGILNRTPHFSDAWITLHLLRGSGRQGTLTFVQRREFDQLFFSRS